MRRLHIPTLWLCALSAAAVVSFAAPAHASLIFNFSDPNGLAAEAEFTVVNPTTLQVRLKNTSTSAPAGFEGAGQILTGLSWDFGPAGPGGISITSGSVFTGPTSSSINFSILNVGPNSDVGGEWGFGNNDGTGALMNFISSNTSQATPFGGANLDGPDSIDGPQGGLVANPLPLDLGGQGAIQNEIIATLNLSGSITESQLLADILANGARVEFGSDAFFINVPAPGALALLAIAGVLGRRRNRRSD